MELSRFYHGRTREDVGANCVVFGSNRSTLARGLAGLLSLSCPRYDERPAEIAMFKFSAITILLLSTLTSAFAAKQYSYFRVGNPNDVTTNTTAGTVLMGGGTDVDAAFQWMCGR